MGCSLPIYGCFSRCHWRFLVFEIKWSVFMFISKYFTQHIYNKFNTPSLYDKWFQHGSHRKLTLIRTKGEINCLHLSLPLKNQIIEYLIWIFDAFTTHIVWIDFLRWKALNLHTTWLYHIDRICILRTSKTSVIKIQQT